MGRQGKQRLDALVVERGLAETRARAQTIIQGGGITVNGTVVTKPAASVAPDVELALVRQPLPYVSRGGLKLKHALDAFDVSAAHKVCADIGASTGGFTDVLLQEGAERVYAIDVGYGQLAWTLRNDPRVVVMERVNIRHVESLPEPVALAVVDVSFISLRQVLPPVRALLAAEANVVVLIKPQFEAGRDQVGKKGVVRDPAVWADVLGGILGWAEQHGWSVLGLEPSPIRGPAGNVEFLAHLRPVTGAGIDVPGAMARVVRDASRHSS
ncbi:MAG TPA: TlyA family RNA methyltransferase [Chloroflexota bacterium]|nr:TlyA family RNA methyltransferase [Chloroflexota bacterium]